MSARRVVPLLLLGWALIVPVTYWTDNSFPALALAGLLKLFVLLASSCLYGALVVPGLAPEGSSPALRCERMTFRILSGLGITALLMLWLGWAGQVNTSAAWAILVAPALFLAVPAFRKRLQWPCGGTPDTRQPPGAFLAAAAVVVFFLLGIDFLFALAPPTFFDTLVYHLALPARWIMSGKIVVEENFFYSFFPLNTELLYALSLLLDDTAQLANLVNFAMGLLFLASVFFAGRRLYGSREASIAVLLTAMIPLFNNLMAVAKHDLSFAAYQTSSVAAFLAWRKENTRGWLALSGLLAGFACATKYNGMILAVSLLFLVAYEVARVSRQRGKAWTGSLASFVVPVMLAPAPYLVRNLIRTGNPVYPTLAGLFGYAPFQKAGMTAAGMDTFVPRGLGEFLAIPWNMVMHADHFGMVFGQTGFLLLVLCPFVLLEKKWSRNALYVACVLAASFVFWALTSPQTRFFLFGLALAALFAARAASLLWEHGLACRAVLLVVLGLGALNNAYRVIQINTGLFHPLRVITGFESKEAYLASLLPPYPAIRFANENLSREDRILFIGETRGFYCRIPYGVSTGQDTALVARMIEEAGSLEGLLLRLREEGYTHVLYNARETARLSKGHGYLDLPEPERRAVFQEFMNGRHFEMLFSQTDVYLMKILYPAQKSPSR